MIPQTPQDLSHMPQDGPTLVLNLLANSAADLVRAWAAAAHGHAIDKHPDAAMLAAAIAGMTTGRERAEGMSDLLALLAGCDAVVFLYEVE